MAVPVANGLTGAQVAREILDRNGLHAVPVEQARTAGRSRTTTTRASAGSSVSAPSTTATSVASTAIAAHEVGHAIQHAKAYKPMEARSALFPVVAFASNTWSLLLFAGFISTRSGLIQVAVVLFAAIVLFQLVTLPVEFDASRRALGQITDSVSSAPVSTRARSAC